MHINISKTLSAWHIASTELIFVFINVIILLLRIPYENLFASLMLLLLLLLLLARLALLIILITKTILLICFPLSPSLPLFIPSTNI